MISRLAGIFERGRPSARALRAYDAWLEGTANSFGRGLAVQPAAMTPGLPLDPPTIIGATGGSGTRVVARIVRAGGMFIGAELNEFEDAVRFGGYSDRWINRFYDTHGAPPAELLEEMSRDLARELEAHLATAGSSRGRWGWKEPRSIYLLPFFHALFEDLSFLHVVRDGRDMALSRNQRQVRLHGDAVLPAFTSSWERPLRSIALWSRINLQAADFGERVLGPRYLRIRFEDLCREPVETVRRIFAFLDVDGEIERLAKSEVEPPETLGRWRQEEPQLVSDLQRIGERALERFGYLTLA